MPKRKFHLSQTVTDFLEVSLVGIIVFIVVYFFVGQLLEISGKSMHPTLQDGERMIAEKLSLKFKDFQRGEIVILINPQYPKQQQKLLVKRIIGLPGETVTISDGKIYINGEVLEEAYLDAPTEKVPDADIEDTTVEQSTSSVVKLDTSSNGIRENDTYKIPEDSFILLGDNREHSKDSREWGVVSKDQIVGRALLVYYPLSSIRKIK